MPKAMSFAATVKQIKNRSKTVTRRNAWAGLQPGTVLKAVEKSMGLKKGQRAVCLAMIRVVSVREEPLEMITQEDCIKEGFPGLGPEDFIMMYQIVNPGTMRETIVRRIEFEYLEEQCELCTNRVGSILRYGNGMLLCRICAGWMKL